MWPLSGMLCPALVLTISFCYSQAQTTVLKGTLTPYDTYDVTTRGVVLPDPGDVMRVAGVVTSWRGYLGGARPLARVRLQLWRPLLGVPGDDVSAVMTSYLARLVGQTDYRALQVFGAGLHTFPLEPHEGLRVESGDILGLQWDGGNPLPHSRGAQCAGAGGGARSMDVYTSLDLSPGPEDSYRGFTELEEGGCRAYSMQVQVTPSACGELVAGTDVKTLQGTARAADGWTDQCWVIRPSDVTTSVHVDVRQVDVTASCDVSQDYLHVRDGPSSTSPLLGRICEKLTPNPTTPRLYRATPGGTVYIRFVAVPEDVDNHFRLTYRAVQVPLVPGEGLNCTMLVLDEAGTSITSPDYPQPYPPDTSSCWMLHTSRSSARVAVEVKDSDLDPWTEDPSTQTVVCNDVVRVYDGAGVWSPVLREWCGDQRPREVVGAGSGVLIWFSSDSTHNQRRGFELRVSSQQKAPLECTVLTADDEERVVTSRGYPVEYPPQWEACWVVSAPRRVKITLQDARLEGGEACPYDYLDLRDGADAYSALLRRSCDQDAGSDVISSGTRMYIHFRSDGSVQGPGFRLTYSATHSENCAIYSAYSYFLEFKSPGYDDPSSYPPSVDLCWTLVAPSDGQRLKLEVVDFQLEKSPGCTADSVRFYDGDLRAPTLGRWCGNHSDGGLLSTGRTLTVRLGTDGDLQGRGFRLAYIALPKHDCESVYASSSESWFTSPHYPEAYSPNTNACWLIEAATGHDVIQIDVIDVNMDRPSIGSKGCDRDVITLRDGNSDDANILMSVCGEDVPNRSIVTSGRFALVTFVSNSQGQGRGFRFKYKSSMEGRCKDVSVQNSVTAMTSPGYPLTYAPYSFGCWILRTASRNSTIRVVVDDLDLASDCGDYVDVMDGDSVEALRLRRWCGGKRPDDVTSSGGVLLVRFISDGRRQGRGFRVYHWEEPAPSATSPAPLETSPAPSDTSIATEIMGTSSTSSSSVTMKTATPDPDPTEAPSSPPSSPTTTSTTQSTRAPSRPASSECIRHVAPLIYWDIISARTYPYVRTGGMDRCWIVTTEDKDATISVKLLNLRIPQSQCQDASQYLEIRDGHSGSAPLMLSVCGSVVPNRPYITTGPAAYIRFTVRTNHSYFNLRYSRINSKITTIIPYSVQSEDSSFDSIVIGLSIGTITILLVLVAIGLGVYKARRKPFVYTDVDYLDDEGPPALPPSQQGPYGPPGSTRAFATMLAPLAEVDRESESTISDEGMFSTAALKDKAKPRGKKAAMTPASSSSLSSIAGGLKWQRDIIIMGVDSSYLREGRNTGGGGGNGAAGSINRGYVPGGDHCVYDDGYTPSTNERMV